MTDENVRGLAEHGRGWAPGPVEETGRIGSWPVRAFADLLDHPAPEGPVLPPLRHRFGFLERAAQRELGEDGHVRESYFLPPIPPRRRMFAGGRVRWLAPVRIGDELVRHSTLAATTTRTGRTGEMLFVTLRHELRRAGELLVVEEEDLVHRRQ